MDRVETITKQMLDAMRLVREGRGNAGSLQRIVRWCARWKYVMLTYGDYAARLARTVAVETVLLECATGRRDALSADECRELARKLGVPDEFRSQKCSWRPDDDGVWNTSCGEMFVTCNDDSPVDNGFRFCPYCGGTLCQEQPNA